MEIKKVFTRIGIAVVVLISLLIIAATLFINLSPEFGGTLTTAQQERYAQSENYSNGIFVNAIPTTRDIGFLNTVRVLYDFLVNKKPGLEPDKPIPIDKIDSLTIIRKAPELKRLTWFGHSACLLEVDGKRIFFDPMLGNTAAPHPLLGPKRYGAELPIEIEKLPYLDAVVFSHDHYDHLDYGSVLKLKDKVGRFFVPLGVSAHLIRWGITSDRITELDWWGQETMDGFTFICTPARHFSGRGLFNGFTTL
jgi:hypothetical protein